MLQFNSSAAELESRRNQLAEAESELPTRQARIEAREEALQSDRARLESSSQELELRFANFAKDAAEQKRQLRLDLENVGEGWQR